MPEQIVCYTLLIRSITMVDHFYCKILTYAKPRVVGLVRTAEARIRLLRSLMTLNTLKSLKIKFRFAGSTVTEV